MNSRTGYGTFGNLSQKYDETRPRIPVEVLGYIADLIPMNARILDVACGTGIVTRQFSSLGYCVVGSDVDTQMIEKALSYKDDIEYHVASADNLPFSEHMFDAVMVFSAFHWFANQKTVREMRRVSKKEAPLVIVNREYPKFKEEYLSVITPFIKEIFTSVKKQYWPADTLAEYGYTHVREKIFHISEQISIANALAYIETVSLWNLIPLKTKGSARRALLEHFTLCSQNGLVTRDGEIRIITGI